MHQTGAEQACQALLSGRKPEQRCSCQTGWLRTTESPRDSRSLHNEKGPVLRDIVTTLTMHPRTEHQTVRGKQRSGCGAERGRALTARGFGAARSNAQVRGAEKQRGHRRARRRRPPAGREWQRQTASCGRENEYAFSSARGTLAGQTTFWAIKHTLSKKEK